MKSKRMHAQIKSIMQKSLPLLKQNGVVKAGIFGSYARGEQKKNSDVDMLIKYKGRKSLFDLVHLERELEVAVGKKIDLLTYNSLHPLIKERVLNEEIRIL